MAIIKVSSLLMLFGFLIEEVSNIPVIKPEQSEVIIPKGGGYTFTCISELSIDWIFSKNGVKSNLDTASYREDDHQVSILSISGANSSHVGLYVCHDMNSKYSYAAIYVYVQGDENLYVGGEDIIYGYGALYLNLFIPCRPTSPDISVKLYETNGNDSQREIQVTKREKDGSSWSYNPSKGFLLSNVTRQSTYFCTFSRDHVVKIPVHYSLARFPPVLTRPVIYFNEPHKWYPEGGVMKVGCEVDYQYSQTPTFIWKLNGTELKTDKNHRFYHNDPFLYQVNPFSYMIVHRVSVYGDSGEYTCEVNIGNYRKKTSQTVNIEYNPTGNATQCDG